MPDEPVSPRAHAALIDAVCRVLASAGDPTRAAGAQRYMRSAMPFHGVLLPEVRRLVTRLAATPQHRIERRYDWEATVRALWTGATHREERYAATTLAGHRLYRRWQDADTLALYRDLIVDAAWWDHVDDLATHHVGDILRADRTHATPVLRAWMGADDLWLRRAAIIAQLQHRGETDVSLLADAIDANVSGTAYGEEFFVRKAIGWALRQHARTDPDWVRAYVLAQGDRLAPLSSREALRHLR